MRFHAPAGFLRGCEPSAVSVFEAGLAASQADGSTQVRGDDARLWVRYLPWDSGYFKCPMYRIDFADWTTGHPPVEGLAREVNRLRQSMALANERYYVFAEVPSEDLPWLQALGKAGFRLIETRLTYFHDSVGRFHGTPSSATRIAAPGDIPNLSAAAAIARNPYDRYHADPFFPPDVADGYLGTYVEACVKGYSDVVIVPDDGNPPDAFVCGSKTRDLGEGDVTIGRLQLAAVAPPRKGWYRALNEALLRWMHDNGVSVVLNTTQSTNGAVIHVSTQLGYRFGRSSHIFAACGP